MLIPRTSQMIAYSREVQTMKYPGLAVLTAVVLLTGLMTQPASAQFNPNPRFGTFNPYSRPPYSPYLNLLRGGSPAINYYGLVRPQEDFRNDFLQLQQSLYTQQSGGYDAGVDALITGNRGGYLNYQRYFLNNRGGGPLGGQNLLGALATTLQGTGGGLGTAGAGAGFGTGTGATGRGLTGGGTGAATPRR
jgi:hypothetical protein